MGTFLRLGPNCQAFALLMHTHFWLVVHDRGPCMYDMAWLLLMPAWFCQCASLHVTEAGASARPMAWECTPLQPIETDHWKATLMNHTLQPRMNHTLQPRMNHTLQARMNMRTCRGPQCMLFAQSAMPAWFCLCAGLPGADAAAWLVVCVCGGGGGGPNPPSPEKGDMAALNPPS